MQSDVDTDKMTYNCMSFLVRPKLQIKSTQLSQHKNNMPLKKQVCKHRRHNKEQAIAGRIRYSIILSNGTRKPWNDDDKRRCQCCAGWFQENKQ